MEQIPLIHLQDFCGKFQKDLIDEIRPRAQTNIPYNRKDFNETKIEFEEEIGIALGQKVLHKNLVRVLCLTMKAREMLQEFK